MAIPNQVQITIPQENSISNNSTNLAKMEEEIDYSERAPWLRAFVLGATDGLVSIASLMMGVGAVQEDVKAMILTGFAGLFAGACSMAIGEFVSVYSQLDIEMAQMRRENRMAEKAKLPNPLQAAMTSALAFSLGAIFPLLAAAFVTSHKVRLGVVVAATTLGLAAFGGGGAVLGRTKVVNSCYRVMVGGWMAMAITFGLTKLLRVSGLEM